MDKKQLLTKTILGSYANFEDAKRDAEFCSQAEVFVHLLKGKHIFLSGGAGSGKSYVIEEYVKTRKKLNPDVNIAITATTGLAALNIGGETIHSLSGLGFTKTTYAEYLKTASGRWFHDTQDRLKAIDILIIDEVSMLSAQALNFVIDRVMHAKGKLPQIILAGDFTQLPPVARSEDISQYGQEIANFCYNCRTWKEINPVVCYLDKSWRAKEQSLKVILENISKGKGRSEETINLLNTIKTTDKIDSLTASVLMTKNKEVDRHNIQCQSQNKGEAQTFKTWYSSEDAKNYGKRVGIPESLTLKNGDRVMITQNINSGNIVTQNPYNPDEFVEQTEIIVTLDGEKVDFAVKNGMVGTLIYNDDGHPMVRYNHDGKTFYIHFLNKHTYVHEEITGDVIYNEYEEKYEPEVLKHVIQQYPLKLAYAISVHKSQGQTLDNVIVDLTDCWTENLGYVALSRVRSSRDIVLLARHGRLGSPKALLVSQDSLTIKREILTQSLRNRIGDLNKELEWLLMYDPIQIKRNEPIQRRSYTKGLLW